MFIVFLVFVLLGVQCGGLQATGFIDTFLKLKSYEYDLNKSLKLEKSDKQLLASWNKNFQLKQVNLTALYRVQMMRHRDHNFRTSVGEKWENCINIHRRGINRMETDYDEQEGDCLRNSVTAAEKKRQAIVQLKKEIKKWRKGYRYLVRLCKSNHFSKKELTSCIVQYVEKDTYNTTLQRLISLKLKAMDELLMQYNKGLIDLEKCLRNSLSQYLTDVRYIMKVLDRCYNEKKNK